VEVINSEGHLYLGMMWKSTKALDLRRDSRCTVHSAVINRDGSEGDFKLPGRANEITDLEVRRRYVNVVYEKIGMRLEDPEYHLFSIDIQTAAFIGFQDGGTQQVSRET